MKPTLEEVAKRELAYPQGEVDETDMTLPEIQDRIPFHVLRLLSGAAVLRIHSKTVEIRCEGNTYIVSDGAFAIYSRIAEKLKLEHLEINGIVRPYSTEGTIRILHAAGFMARTECNVPPEKLRVLFLRNGEGGCAFYRVIQPVMEMLDSETLWVEENGFLTYRLGCNYDCIVAPRISDPFIISLLKALQQAGKIIIYETDDLLDNIPDWNPNSQRITPEMNLRREFLKNVASAVITSTEELKEGLGRPETTWVCHNGIDPVLWPMKVKDQETDVVRILWGGSSTHDDDLIPFVKAAKRLIGRYKNKVHFVFAGSCPQEFKAVIRQGGRLSEIVSPDFSKNVTFMGGCTAYEWPKFLEGACAHIVVAPLKPHIFNEAKSELKVLEGWALGLPVIASRIAPYERAIEKEEQGVLVSFDAEAWEMELDRLIHGPELRTKLATAGLERLKERYVMSKVVEEYERALLTIARGKCGRKECNAAIEERLKGG